MPPRASPFCYGKVVSSKIKSIKVVAMWLPIDSNYGTTRLTGAASSFLLITFYLFAIQKFYIYRIKEDKKLNAINIFFLIFGQHH